MSERPTPETDANTYRASTLASADYIVTVVQSGFARRLERQLAEAREQIAELETRHAATMIHTQAIVDDANSIRDKRDRLAEAAEQMMTYRPNGLSECQHEVGVWNDLAEALAAVKEVQQ